jgi:signal transduction histidine kinase/CheY-like chemotaxis protein
VRIEAHIERDEQQNIERIIGTIQDVTGQKDAEAIRAKLEERLRQAEKLEAVGGLAGGIAHDFNNILGAIRGYAELALDVTPDNPKAQNDLGLVLQATERAAELVANLLAFSRQSLPRHERLRLEEPVRESLRLLRSTVAADVSLRESYDAATPEIAGDRTQMLQVVMNLVSNAVQAMASGGGVLSLSLAPCRVEASKTRSNPDLGEGLYALLSVSDTGCGIEPRLLGRVFEPFFSTKPSGRGTGLGLSVVHGIVRAHGGALEIESRPEEGTTVRAYFPAQTSTADETDASPALAAGRRGHGQRVLVVEDDGALAELERRRLEALGYETTIFTDAREALETLRRRPSEFDLLLTDHAMPHLSGIELAHEVHAIRADLPVLLVSGYGETVPPECQEAARIRGILRKPVARQTLAEAVAAALEEAEPPGPSS